MSPNTQLLIFPFAGGSSNAFKKTSSLLDRTIEVIAFDYPGRGRRRQEHVAQSYADLLYDARVQIRQRCASEKPIAALGYSLGAVVLYDLLPWLEESYFVAHTFFCARASLDQADETKTYAFLPESDFRSKMTKLGGIDRELLADERFSKLHFDSIRSDYLLWAQHSFERRDIRSSASILYSERDTPFQTVSGWRKLIQGHVSFFELGTNHFFINECPERVADVINAEIRSL